MQITRPMLAAKTTESIIEKHLRHGPLIVSPKLDGIRGLVIDGQLLSRSFKPIRNRYTQKLFGRSELNGLDGELIVGPMTAKNVYNVTNSGVMSEAGEPDVTFYVFDLTDGRPYKERMEELYKYNKFQGVINLESDLAFDLDEVLAYEESCLKDGFEGIMLRKPFAPYKCNRSTANEGYLMKLKRFIDSEAQITGMVELMHNANPAEVNELGLTKRSSRQENKVGMDIMGALQVRDLQTGVEFELGTGFTQAMREQFWESQYFFIGKIVKYKYLPIGIKDKPRNPVFLGMRDLEDF